MKTNILDQKYKNPTLQWGIYIGGPSEIADFVLFRSQMLEINFFAFVCFTELHDLDLFFLENLRREFK
ncbi:MAG: hypothetical protein WCP56_02375 [Candidatus Saccharibacteria bacterium]